MTSPTELRDLAAELDNRGDSLTAVILHAAADQLEQQNTSLAIMRAMLTDMVLDRFAAADERMGGNRNTTSH